MRFKLFLREPEAIFWIFCFPILLAMGLGIAFRNRPADVLQVGATTAQLAQALAADKGLTSVTLDEQAGTHALATGNILLLAIQRPDAVSYTHLFHVFRLLGFGALLPPRYGCGGKG